MGEAQNAKQRLDYADNPRPTDDPEVYIALRTESDTEPSTVTGTVYSVSCTIALLNYGPGCNTRIHLLEKNMKNFEEAQAWLREVGSAAYMAQDHTRTISFSPIRDFILGGSSRYEGEKVCELLWKDGESL